MYYDIVEFILLEDYSIELFFKNGKSGNIDLKEFISPHTIFEKLLDKSFFNKVYLNSGVLTWPDDIDIAPETIYYKATGESLPVWMQE